jgi:leucine dehydrogenase
VICAPEPTPPEGRLRRDLLLDFGDLVESLGGSYVTAEDVGTDADDMAVIAERTTHVTGQAADRGGTGDPSPVTALGVLSAIHGCAERRFGTRELAGRRIVVVGLGHVGSNLARMLAGAGARVAVSDIDPARRATATEIGARWIDPAEAMSASCDILAPCALGGAIDGATLPRLRCVIVCGAANNVLADESLARRLAEAGILYAPDFIVNAGGLINVYRELHDYDAEHALELARGIEDTVTRIVAEAEARGVTPLAAARALAERRLDAASGEPPDPPRPDGEPKRGLIARGRLRLGATLAR